CGLSACSVEPLPARRPWGGLAQATATPCESSDFWTFARPGARTAKGERNGALDPIRHRLVARDLDRHRDGRIEPADPGEVTVMTKNNAARDQLGSVLAVLAGIGLASMLLLLTLLRWLRLLK